MLQLETLGVAAAMVALCSATTFIPEPQGVTFKQSEVLPGASLSFKETDICDTTPGVKSYSGFVTLPSEDNTYNASIFFWYFTSRHNSSTAPTTIYMPGGPGESFLDAASGFPCIVNEDSNSTTLNQWSWNDKVNMLYIDIPVQTGYSYTNAQNGSYSILSDTLTPLDTADDIVLNLTTTVATLSSQDGSQTANTTQQVARQLWQISQIWFQEFPEWHTENKEINVWGYSYSGFFAPASAAYIVKQNELISTGTYKTTGQISNPIYLPLGTLGLNNGCMDIESQVSYWPTIMVNNTYGIKIIDDSTYEQVVELADECQGLVAQCRAAAAELDPEGTGAVAEVNNLCVNVTATCFVEMEEVYSSSNRSAFDFTLPLPGQYPYAYSMAFYNQRWVQEALGVPVNFTITGYSIIDNMFYMTGDPMLPTIGNFDYLASSGVGLAFVYGDRDFQCNWLGAENVSLSTDYPEAEAFRSAGYTPIVTNASYQGGLVRQHNRVSFSRVFEAGHSVAAYQPETVFRIFERAILGQDVATGKVHIAATSNSSLSGSSSSSSSSSCSRHGTKSYSTVGPASVFNVTNEIFDPILEAPQCYWYAASPADNGCTEEQYEALANGTAVVENWIVVNPSQSFYITTGSAAPLPTGIQKRRV